MRILLNGVELARRAENNQTVGEVLEEVRSEIYAGGKIVTRIGIDGQPLAAGRARNERLAVPVSTVRALELTVEEPTLLKLRTLRDAAALAEKLAQQARPLSRKFRIGDEVTANNELAQFLGDLKLVLEGLDLSTRSPEANTGAVAVRDRILESANRLLPCLDRLYKAQAGGDYIALADELEYDLCEQISAWEPLLRDAERSLGPISQAQ
jgi:hypothetical protein